MKRKEKNPNPQGLLVIYKWERTEAHWQDCDWTSGGSWVEDYGYIEIVASSRELADQMVKRRRRSHSLLGELRQLLVDSKKGGESKKLTVTEIDLAKRPIRVGSSGRSIHLDVFVPRPR